MEQVLDHLRIPILVAAEGLAPNYLFMISHASESCLVEKPPAPILCLLVKIESPLQGDGPSTSDYDLLHAMAEIQGAWRYRLGNDYGSEVFELMSWDMGRGYRTKSLGQHVRSQIYKSITRVPEWRWPLPYWLVLMGLRFMSRYKSLDLPPIYGRPSKPLGRQSALS